MQPDKTLIFADHNVMITFHIMVFQRHILASDLKPESQVELSYHFLIIIFWFLKYSFNSFGHSFGHGPVHCLEPQAACNSLARWREQAIKMRNDMAIFLTIKGNQQVFNGYGAQETCDML